MTIAPGVEVIETSFWNRPLNLVLFCGEELALVDTGLAETPRKAILPFLSARRLAPEQLAWVIITHAHVDHFGGNDALWRASSHRARFAVHGLDRATIEDPATQVRRANERYVKLGLITPSDLENGIEACGGGVKVNRVLEGGEVFPLGKGLELQIHFAPGHSAGNISVLERKNRILVQGETVAGVGQYSTTGELLTVPAYEDVEAYLSTIARIARLDFDLLVPSHLPVMNRTQASKFFDDSLTFVIRFEQEVRKRLQSSKQPVKPLSLWQSMNGLWGQYRADIGLYALLEAHLKRLLQRGLAAGSLSEGLVLLEPDCDDLAQLEQAGRSAIRDMVA